MLHARLSKPANLFDLSGVAACVALAVLSMRPLGAQVADPLEILSVQGAVHLIAGAGGNIAVQAGPDGLVLVDSGAAGSTAQVLAAIKRLSDQPIRYIINTSAHPEHVGGNAALAAAGRTLASGAFNSTGPGAMIIGNEAVLARMSAPTGQVSPYPEAAWPGETFPKRKSLYLNGEGIQVLHQPAAHSDGDAIVFFRRSDVVVTGEIFDTTRFPVIDVDRGGSVKGELAALNGLIDLVLPQTPLAFREGGTLVVPGRGRISDQADLVEYRDMVTIVRDVVQSLMSKGMTRAQVVAASPAKGYERRFGATSGPWTTTMFVEAVYRSLEQEKKK